MPFIKTFIPDLLIYEPVVHEDSRGYFFESYNENTFLKEGVAIKFVQDNQAKSGFGVIRGLHYQLGPHAQTKLIRTLSGTILDVAVDIRKGSPTYGKAFSIELSGENKKQLLVPKGFAHGYSVISATAEVSYKCDSFYNKESEGGIVYNDPLLEIDWKVPADKAIVADRDQQHPLLANCKNNFVLKNNLPTILVTGANGQLGNELRVLSAAYPTYYFLFVTRNELEISDALAVKKYFDTNKIDYCINCAAYTAVDKAEIEKEVAFKVNADAVGYLAKACEKHQAQFLHISTDYVFDGTAVEPIEENEHVHPLGVYGLSKLRGEQLAISNLENTIIIRTSWVYSSFGNNFVKTMLRLMKEKESINVVSDQRGCPTYAADLADAILQIVSKTNDRKSATNGIFNYSNSGSISWYEFALTIKELSGSQCIVHPIPTSQYPTPAKRPSYSVLDTAKIRQTFGITIPEWKESLKKCLAILAAK